MHLEAISSCPATCYLGEVTDPHLTTPFFQGVVESQKVSLSLLLSRLNNPRNFSPPHKTCCSSQDSNLSSWEANWTYLESVGAIISCNIDRNGAARIYTQASGLKCHVTMPSNFHKTLMPNSAVYSNFWGSADCQVIPKYRKVKKKKKKSKATSYGREYNIFSQTMLVIVEKAVPSVSILLVVEDLLHQSHSEAVPGVQVQAESCCCPLIIKVSEAQKLPLSAHFCSRRCHWQHFHSLFIDLRTGNR